MTSLPRFFRTTLAGGILFLLPAIVLVAIVGKALEIAHKIIAPLAELLPVPSLIGLDAPMLLAVGLVILFCFLAGVVARTTIAQRATNYVEAAALSHVPGYEFVKAISQSLLVPEKSPDYTVVLARFDDVWQLAFFVERLKNGHVAVFVPGSPSPQSGSVYFMTEDRVKTTDITFNAAMKCLKRYGKGAGALLEERLAAAAPAMGQDPSES